MATNPILLCIHRDPAQLKVLKENGYELLTAPTGREGLRLFRSQPVDAIVLEYNLGLLDGSVIASEIRQVRPKIPIIMVAEHAELPDGALQAIDVLVSSSDPPHFVWAAVHFLLNVKHKSTLESAQMIPETATWRRSGTPREDLRWRPADRARLRTDESATGDLNAPFSRSVWKSIRNGTVQF